MKLLPSYEVRQDIFDQILYDFDNNVEITSEFDKYVYGYSNKKTIYYDGNEYLICREYILNHYTHAIKDDCTEWKQVKLRRVLNKETKADKVVSGTYSYNYVNKILRKYYSAEEIEDILNNHIAEYDKGFIQYKYTYPLETNQLKVFDNTYKYDINGAHCDALVELFPKAKKEFMNMYRLRKKHPNYKNIFNFYVGFLVKVNHRLTYNWIVQRTTRKLYEAMDITGGQLIYANTDGYVIDSPQNTLQVSKYLGDFKLEYSGKTYIYQSENYWIMQNGDELRGSCLTEARKYIDLSKGLIAKYYKRRELLGYDKNNQPKYRFILENLRQEKINEDS